MLENVTSKIGAALGRFVSKKLLMVKKAASRFPRGTNGRIVFEFLILISILSTVGIAASRWSTTTIASHGNLRIDGVGVYDDRDCTSVTTSLDWGTLEPGSTENITVYIRNEGNLQTTLLLTAENWHPVSASIFMRLDWNYRGESLDPMEVAELTLTLSVSSEAENMLDFSFDVIIGTNE